MSKKSELDDLLKLVIDSLYLSILIDDNGKICYIGREYADILGVTFDEAIGASIEKIIPNTCLPRVLKTGVEEIGELFMMKNGELTICNRFPIRDKNGIIKGALSTATFYDLDHVKSLNNDINKLNSEIKSYQQKLSLLKKIPFNLDDVVGQSYEILKIKDTIKKIANSNLSVLITGETGTGKEIFANAIHSMSNRRFENFVKINCASIPKDLMESELFGYDEGAFSGAKKGGKTGKLEYANKGTILLDEVGEIPFSLQAKLLRVLQEKELEKIGSNKVIDLNIRIICCTNKNIREMVKNSAFREDLFYRINIVEIHIPPLRERKDDIPHFCEHFIEKINKYHGSFIEGISPKVMTFFEQYNWPGNIRELEHVLERACISTKNKILNEEDFDFFLPRIFQDQISEEENIKNSLSYQKNKAECLAILKALESTNKNKTKAAKILKITRSQLYEKLRKYNLI
ncbi:sigma-54 interaction domain-containing protein [Fusobacterium sp. PH5-44]|uniref:sigma-54 interaction domain-containing protein n=1 Tax=unclassified Fusobacterium TaxID=2648384 RepID=UPI003D1FEB2B